MNEKDHCSRCEKFAFNKKNINKVNLLIYRGTRIESMEVGCFCFRHAVELFLSTRISDHVSHKWNVFFVFTRFASMKSVAWIGQKCRPFHKNNLITKSTIAISLRSFLGMKPFVPVADACLFHFPSFFWLTLLMPEPISAQDLDDDANKTVIGFCQQKDCQKGVL